jgi:hypothetical protein
MKEIVRTKEADRKYRLGETVCSEKMHRQIKRGEGPIVIQYFDERTGKTMTYARERKRDKRKTGASKNN